MRLFVLGAPDPEMDAIEKLLNDAGERFAHAVDKDGRRVLPGDAYVAAGYAFPDDPLGIHHGPAWADVTHLIECDAAPSPDGSVWTRSDVASIDHHRPGDPGYGRPPEEFLAASSIGQVVAELARLGRLPEWGVGHSDCTQPDGCWDVDGEVPSEIWSDGLARNVPDHIVLCAAADHCLEAAYRGRCPGVDPDALMQWRA